MFDCSPLTRPLTRAQVDDIKRREAAGEFGPRGSTSAMTIVTTLVIVIVGLVMVGQFMMFSAVMRSTPSTMPGGGIPAAFKIFPAFFLVVLAIIVVQLLRGVGHRNDWHQVAAFAITNGLQFARRSANPTYPGLLFGVGGDRVATDHVWTYDGELADVGHYSYTTGSGDNETTHRWIYAAFRLPRMVPHLVLDNRSNNGLGSNLPAMFSKDQQVPVGGLFDKQWTLYAPSGYGQDAYQLLAADVIDALVSNHYTFDLELVDNWMFLYSQHGSPSDPMLWQQIESIRAAVVDRIAHRPYVDRRFEGAAMAPAASPMLMGNPGQPMPPVAPQGRRLRTTWNRGVILVLVLFGAQWAFMHLIFPVLVNR